MLDLEGKLVQPQHLPLNNGISGAIFGQNISSSKPKIMRLTLRHAKKATIKSSEGGYTKRALVDTHVNKQ